MSGEQYIGIQVQDGTDSLLIKFPADMASGDIQQVLRDKFGHLKQPTTGEVLEKTSEAHTEAVNGVAAAVNELPKALEGIPAALKAIPRPDNSEAVAALEGIAESLGDLSKAITDNQGDEALQMLTAVQAELTKAIKGMDKTYPTYQLDVTRDRWGIKTAVMKPV